MDRRTKEQPDVPTQTLNKFLLSAIDMSIRLNFTSDQRYFVAKTTTKKPRLHVTEAKLFLMACLFEPDALLRVEHRLASGQLQLPFLCNVTKSFR